MAASSWDSRDGRPGDPQFSYGAIIWKAIGALITKIVTAPFRALGAMLGGVATSWSPSSSTPAAHACCRGTREAAAGRAVAAETTAAEPDGAAAVCRAGRPRRAQGARRAAGSGTPGRNRAGPDDAPPPVDFGDGDVRKAVRELYVARFAMPN
jgi:hypothetical protein